MVLMKEEICFCTQCSKKNKKKRNTSYANVELCRSCVCHYLKQKYCALEFALFCCCFGVCEHLVFSFNPYEDVSIQMRQF